MKCENSYSLLGFWIFLSVFIAVDAWLFSQGYEAIFFEAKTSIEKEIQALKLEKLKR